jgi:hypothetical protein
LAAALFFNLDGSSFHNPMDERVRNSPLHQTGNHCDLIWIIRKDNWQIFRANCSFTNSPSHHFYRAPAGAVN